MVIAGHAHGLVLAAAVLSLLCSAAAVSGPALPPEGRPLVSFCDKQPALIWCNTCTGCFARLFFYTMRAVAKPADW